MFALIRGWTSPHRTTQHNTQLGVVLACVAGATNAGGFLAVGQYTSHMTGVVSAAVDSLVLGHFTLALAGLGMLCAFIVGSMCSAILVNWGLRRALHSAYGLPLLLEAFLLLAFGLFGARMQAAAWLLLPLTVLLLCFIMGLQNATMTKISRAEIRTTHITGLVTDIGIELGKMLYINDRHGDNPVRANYDKLRLHSKLFAGFFSGAIAGAVGFQSLGFVTSLPLALLLLMLTGRALLLDVRQHWRALG